jgi:hypothetical protein
MAAKERPVKINWRRYATLVAWLLASAAGTVPACGTMGGGSAMHYLYDPCPDAPAFFVA